MMRKMLIMKKSNPLSRNLATVLLIGSLGMTAWAQKVPTDPPVVNQISPEKKSDRHQKNHNSPTESINEKGKQGKPDTVGMQPRKETAGDEQLLTVVQVETSDREAFETSNDDKADKGSFLITRDGDLSHPLEVYYHLSGSAVNGKDYVRLNGTATIAQGQNSVKVTVQALEDEEVEGVEEVILTLEDIVCIAIFPPPPSCYQVGKKNTSKLKVFENDHGINLLPKSGIITPGKNKKFQAPATLSITGEAIDEDGWISSFQFLVNEEVVHEGTMNFVVAPESGQRQHFNYQWKEVTPGNHDITLAVTDNEGASTLSRPVKVMVIGDEDLPELTIFTKDALATETTDNASAPSDTATFRIRRTGRTDTALEVSYQTSGSAANGIDYEGLEGSMVIESGQRWGKVILKPIADDMREGRETIALSLVPSILTYAVGHPSTAKAVIMDTPP